MEYVFCDTMIFLHFTMFNEIDFCNILNVKSVTLIIPEVVSDEIDNHKDNHKRDIIRNRATKVSKNFYKYLVETDNSEFCFHDNFKIKFLPSSRFDYSSYNLNQDKGDHKIIASIIDFRKSIKETDHITFITHDNGASLTAKKHNIPLYRLPDKFKLADKRSQEEQEIIELKKELANYKSASPSLKIQGKKDKSNTIKYTIKDAIGFSTPDNLLSIEETKEQCPPAEQFEVKPLNEVDYSLIGNSIISKEQEREDIKRYTVERENYFLAYQHYLSEMKYRSSKVIFKVELEIVNIGHAPAEKVDLHIHFPDGFEMFTEENIPEAPECPQKPLPPRTRIELLASRLQPCTENWTSSFNVEDMLDIRTDTFSLTKTNSYDFRDSYEMLKHGDHLSHDIITMFIMFDDENKIKNFQSKFILSGANIPNAVSGTLNFVFELSEE